MLLVERKPVYTQAPCQGGSRVATTFRLGHIFILPYFIVA